MRATTLAALATDEQRKACPRLPLTSDGRRDEQQPAAGRRDEAAALARTTVPAGWPDEHDARFLRLRAGQLRNDPARAEWPVYAVALRERGRPMVGHAGFHGPPGTRASQAPRSRAPR